MGEQDPHQVRDWSMLSALPEATFSRIDLAAGNWPLWKPWCSHCLPALNPPRLPSCNYHLQAGSSLIPQLPRDSHFPKSLGWFLTSLRLQPLHSCRLQNRWTSPVPSCSPSSLSPASSNSSITFTLRVEILWADSGQPVLHTAFIAPSAGEQFPHQSCIRFFPRIVAFPWLLLCSWWFSPVRSVTLSCPTLCDLMDCSTPGLPAHHQFPEFTQTHVYRVGDAIQPSHPVASPSPPALNLSQSQGLFQWLSSSHQVATVLEFQLQHQSFQWTPRTDFL